MLPLSPTSLSAFRALLATPRTAVIVCHVNADGDAIGSTLALQAFLRQHNWQATVVIPDYYPDFLRFLPGTRNIVRTPKQPQQVAQTIQQADTIIFLDLGDIRRTATLEPLLTANATATTVLIDHHPEPLIKADITMLHPEASSTCEVIYHIIKELTAEPLPADIATCLYTGIMTDTGNLAYNSNDPELFHTIAELLAAGIDKDQIHRNVYNTFSVDRLRLTGYVLYQKLRVLSPLRASYYTLSRADQQRFHYTKGDAEGLVNLPLQINHHLLSISLREDSEKPNLVWVSLRSVPPLECNTIAQQYFNGGGHPYAAGGKLHLSLTEAEQHTRKALQAISKQLL